MSRRGTPSADTPPRTDWWLRAAGGLLLAVVAAFLVFCAVWRVDGGRWVHVETPSMGSVAPVGSLLWLKPTDFDKLKPGDFITFHPPGTKEVTYSHRVYELNDDGTITTKGVIPAPDPWKLTATEVVGEVRMNWWGVGWLVVAGPVLIMGFLVVGLARSLVWERWKVPITLVFGSLVISIAIIIYQPFINAQQLSFAPSPHGGADASYVGTGLLPIRLQGFDGDGVVLNDGEVGKVHVSKVKQGGRLEVALSPAIPLWWWIALVLTCFVPAFYSVIIGRRPLAADEPDPEAEGGTA